MPVISPANYADAACKVFIGADRSKWPAYFPDMRNNDVRRAMQKDPDVWAKACPNPLGLLVRDAVAIGGAETDWNNTVTHLSDTGEAIGNIDHGPWQISSFWWGPMLARHPRWWLPDESAAMMKAVYESGGWKNWSVYNGTSPRYLGYLRTAQLALANPFPYLPESAGPSTVDLSGVYVALDELHTLATAQAAELATLRGELRALKLSGYVTMGTSSVGSD